MAVIEWRMGGREGTPAEAEALAKRFDMPGATDNQGYLHLRVTVDEQRLIIRALFEYASKRCPDSRLIFLT